MALGLGLAFLILYHVNGGFLPGHDATANLYLPLALLEGEGFSFRPETAPQMFIWRLTADDQTRTVRVPAWARPVDAKSQAWLEGVRPNGPAPATWADLRAAGTLELVRPEYYMVPSVDPPARGYVNQYGPGAGLTALPLFAVLQGWTGGLADRADLLWYGGKLLAALCVAASVALVFLTVLALAGRTGAIAVSVVYGAGTCVWSVASQTLWQSGPNVFFLALAAFCLTRPGRSAWWALGCGAAAGWAVVCRPTSALVVLAIGAYLAALAVHRLRSRGPSPASGRGEAWRPLAAFVLGGLPAAVFLAAYNTYYLGSPLRFGQTLAGSRLAEDQLGTADAWGGAFWEGFYGLLVSPSRGLLVYSPVLVFAAWGMFQAWRDRRFERLRPLSVAVVLLLLVQAKWFNWHGGWSFGYRLMVDAMPLAAVCAAAIVEPVRRHKALLAAAGALFAWSLGVQVIGAFAYDVVGWNFREALVVQKPDGAAVLVADRGQAVEVAKRTGGAVQKVFMDVDRRAWHGRLWSVRDSQLAYYATHFAQSRAMKKQLIEAALGPP